MEEIMNRKKIISMLITLSLCAGAAGCTSNSASNTTSTSTSSSSTEILSSINISASKAETVGAAGTSIVLGNSSTVSGSGATVSGSTVTITAAGTYSVKGTLADGQIIVNAGDKDNVYIILSGADISSSSSAPIYIENADKAVIWTAEGTENHLASTAAAAEAGAEPDAALYSKADLVISGTGSLSVESTNNKGIVSNDDLKIQNGSMEVTSAADGIKGKDSVEITGGTISVNAKGDGIVSDNATDAGKGYILIEGGKISITSGEDGIQGEINTLIKNGDITISTNGGSANSSDKSNWGQAQPGGQSQSQSTTTTTTTKVSAKAIKAGLNIVIEGGTFNIDSSDDALNSKNNMVISGGTFNMSSGDDGLHSDSTLTINSGTLNLTKTYEGIESNNITVNGGNVELVSSDDGFNVSGGSDSSSTSGRQGQNSFNSDSGGVLTINGGNINVNAVGDGLDSNGSIKMTAGEVTVNGPTDNSNGAIDYNGTFDISGGTLIAAGSSGMAQAPSTSSTQNSVKIALTSQAAGTAVSIKDSSGTEIASITPAKQFASVVVSSPDIKSGSVYTVYVGAEEVGSFTASGAVSEVTQAGASTGGMGGPGGQSGQQHP
jgi:hypothetical protein